MKSKIFFLLKIFIFGMLVFSLQSVVLNDSLDSSPAKENTGLADLPSNLSEHSGVSDLKKSGLEERKLVDEPISEYIKQNTRKSNRNKRLKITTRTTTTVSFEPNRKKRKRNAKKPKFIPNFDFEKSKKNILDQIGSLFFLSDKTQNEDHNRIFSDSYEDAHTFGPFATIIKELLLESREMARQKYYEGTNLDENDYNEKVMEPILISIRDDQEYPDGNQDDEEPDCDDSKNISFEQKAIPILEGIVDEILGHKQKTKSNKNFEKELIQGLGIV